MEIEALKMGLTGPGRGDPGGIGVAPEAKDASSGPSPERHAPLDGGAADAREQGPESVLPKADLEANYQREIFSDAELNQGYGIGFALSTYNGPDYRAVFIGQSGGVAGYVSVAIFELHANVGIILLHNGLDPRIGDLRDLFMQKLDVKGLAPPPARQ